MAVRFSDTFVTAPVVAPSIAPNIVAEPDAVADKPAPAVPPVEDRSAHSAELPELLPR